MNTRFFILLADRLRAVTVPLLAAYGLAGCSHPPAATADAAAPAAAPTPAVAGPAAAPAPVAAVATVAKALPTRGLSQSQRPKPTPAAPPVAATPAPVEVASPAAGAAPEPAAPAPTAPATHTQAGRVLDESGRPLVGATVLLRGTTKGTSTDATGGYALEVPNGENTFVIGYGGYEDETVSSRDGQPLNVTLLPLPSSKAEGRRERH